MVLKIIFGTVGGLGLFFFGMELLADAIKAIAGRKLKKLLESLTKTPLMGVLVGTLITGIIQSSSATTVMLIGFVNAGLLTLKQALGVVMGANIGTTVTAWLVSTVGIEGFDITAYALPAVGIGFLLRLGGRTKKIQGIGNILLGFGLLFIGIRFLEEAFIPLKDNAQVQEVLIWVGKNPLYAVIAGTLFTMLIQSSSASIAIVQVLALQGVFGTDWDLVLRVTIPYILGSNIGTTITAQLAALRTSRNSKRVAMGHTLFNVIGVIYMFPFVGNGWFADLVKWVAPFSLSEGTILPHIAIAHTIFNVVNTIVFLPAVKPFEYLIMKIIPVKKEELAQKPVILEKHLLATPVLAMEQVKREIVRMIKTAKDAVNSAVDGLVNGDRKLLELARKGEDMTDDFQYEITSYLTALSVKEPSEELLHQIPVLLHTINDLERVGDHAVNISEIAERKIGQRISFSNLALTEASKLKEQANEMFDGIIKALDEENIEGAKAALLCEDNLNKMQVDFRRSHVRRMTEHACSPESGLIFIDLVDNVEKIGDHLTNIAQSVIGGLQWDGAEAKKTLQTEEEPT